MYICFAVNSLCCVKWDLLLLASVKVTKKSELYLKIFFMMEAIYRFSLAVCQYIFLSFLNLDISYMLLASVSCVLCMDDASTTLLHMLLICYICV